MWSVKKGDLHNRRADRHNSLPLITVKRDDAEETLQEGDVEQGKVKSHG